MAILQGLRVIPAINKIDSPLAEVEAVKKSIVKEFGFEEDEIHMISARSGLGVKQLLEDVIEKVSAPQIEVFENESVFKGFLVDSFFVKDLGVVLVLHVRGGELRKGDLIASCAF
jgi:translation elongation factor EF-4